MLKNNGSFLERLVQVIEQSLAPGSFVDRNVKLPILSSADGAKAQCDIVIRTGMPPRETITIVEVQDRQSPVDINEFRGWMEKLRDVGAQHLYCVSRKPFAKSIKEKAALSGNTVKLITLSQLDTDQIPINFFKTTFVYHDIDTPSIKKNEVIFPSLVGERYSEQLKIVNEDLAKLKTNDLKFAFYPLNLTALSSICIDHVSERKDTEGEIESLKIGYDKPIFYLFTQSHFLPIKMDVEFTWSSKRVEIPVTILSYDQNEHGTLAWVVESFYDSNRGPIWIKIPVTKSGNEYLLSGMLLTIPANMQFSFHLEKNPSKAMT
jgi:hypothetical protein